MIEVHVLALDVLVNLLRKRMHELHEYIHELASSTSLHLPIDEAEFEKRRWRGANSVH